MNVPDDYIEGLKHEIANLKAMLEPLESGRMQMGTRRSGEAWVETTPAWVQHLKKNIDMYQDLVDRHDAKSDRAVSGG